MCRGQELELPHVLLGRHQRGRPLQRGGQQAAHRDGFLQGLCGGVPQQARRERWGYLILKNT